MNSNNLLNDPNFLRALHELHFKVIVDRLAKWKNISITDLSANEEMNKELERLFGIPVYEEHKAMLRKATTQPRFYDSTLEEIITTMTKEEKAKDQAVFSQPTNSSSYFRPSTSSSTVVTNVQAPLNKTKISLNQQTGDRSPSMGLCSTSSDAMFNGYTPSDRNHVLAMKQTDTPKQQAVDLPSFIRSCNISDTSLNDDQSQLNGNLAMSFSNSSNHQIFKSPNFPRLRRTSSTLVNSEQASVLSEVATTEESLPTPALYSVVLQKQTPASKITKEPSGFGGFPSAPKKSNGEHVCPFSHSCNSDECHKNMMDKNSSYK